jgi:1,4-alpha-glucan branching enzyme
MTRSGSSRPGTTIRSLCWANILTRKARVEVCVYIPHAVEVSILEGNRPHGAGRRERFLQVARRGRSDVPEHYRLDLARRRASPAHRPRPLFSYAPRIGDLDLHLLERRQSPPRLQGSRIANCARSGRRRRRVVRRLGAERRARQRRRRLQPLGRSPPPDARSPRQRHLGNLHPDLAPGAFYRFEIRNRQSGEVLLKSDPYGQQFEARPKTASIVVGESGARLAGRRVDGQARRVGLAARAHVGLRGASGLVAARARGRAS